MTSPFKQFYFCTFLILLISSTSFGQFKYIKGTINLKVNKTRESDLFIRLYSSKKYNRQINKVSINNSQFKIDSLSPAEYVIGIVAIGEPHIFVKIDLFKLDSVNLKIDYPPENCPYNDSNKICPFGHRNKIKRIRYGYPSSFMMFMARLRIYHLGGDLCSDCDPKYYCKKHHLDF